MTATVGGQFYSGKIEKAPAVQRSGGNNFCGSAICHISGHSLRTSYKRDTRNG